MIKKNLFWKSAAVSVAVVLFCYALSTPVRAEIQPDVMENMEPLAASKWRFKRQITIENNGIRAENVVIEIQLKSSDFDYTQTQAGGLDIRFSEESGNAADAGVSHWIEQWNEKGFTRIWVKVPVLKAKTRSVINMYYGNPLAPNASDGNKTFLFFDDFESGNFSRKWTNESVGDVKEEGGALKLKETDGQDGIVAANFNISGPMIIRTLYQRQGADEHWVRAGVGGWNTWLCFGDHTDNAATGTNYVMLFDSASLASLKSAPLTKATNAVINDKWRRVSYWFDGKTLKGMQDGVTTELPMKNQVSKLALRTLDNDSWDNFAYVTVSNYINSEPKVTIGDQQKN